MHELGAREIVEHHARQMRRGAVARRGKAQLVGLRLVERDQVLHVLHRQALAHHQNVGQITHIHDRREARAWVVVHLLVQALVDGQRPRCAEHDGVAIGLGALHELRTDVAARARLVVHDHALPQFLAQLRRQHARHGIGRPAGRKWHDESHRALRKFLGRDTRADRQTGHHRSRCGQNESTLVELALHAFVSRFFRC